MAEIYLAAGEYATLAALLTPLVAEERKKEPVHGPRLSQLLSVLGAAYNGQTRWAEAEQVLREALAIRERETPNSWTASDARSRLGGALLGQEKYAEAEPLLLKGYEGMRARERVIPRQSRHRLPDTLDRLIELYAATGKPDEARKYRDLRAAYPPEPAPPPKVVK